MALRGDTLRLALSLAVRRPARTGLTLLGLAIGVGAFIAMLSFGEGARRAVLAQFRLLGTNLLRAQSIAPAPGLRPPRPLTKDDVEVLARDAVLASQAFPVGRRGATVARGGERRMTTIYGVTPSFTALHEWPVVDGGGLVAEDLAAQAPVCVLGQTPARTLFGDEDPLGQTVTLAGAVTCHVVGVLLGKGFSTSGADVDDLVLVPLTVFRTRLSEQVGYSYLEIRPADPALVDAAEAEVTRVLREAHGIEPGAPSDFTVSSPLEVIRAADRTSRTLQTLLAAIAAVSLLVGGIGIMNIQLVSVSERTEEIGVRAAIGAAPRQILFQFLVEAFVITGIGTAAGVLLGFGAATIVAAQMGWPRVISPAGVATAIAFGLAIGVVFGYLPAKRAADLDPIGALRHE